MFPGQMSCHFQVWYVRFSCLSFLFILVMGCGTTAKQLTEKTLRGPIQ